MNRNGLARHIDQTTLKPGANYDYVAEFCRNTEENHFASVCILSNMTKMTTEALKNFDTKVCMATSFPLGFGWSDVKIHETEGVLDKGVQEADLVTDVSTLKSERHDIIIEELDGVVEASHARGAIVKPIIKTLLPTGDQIVEACGLAGQYGTGIVKTPIGLLAMLPHSTSVGDAKLARSSVKPETGIKAAGGTCTTVDAPTMTETGTTRAGASAGEEIIGDL